MAKLTEEQKKAKRKAYNEANKASIKAREKSYRQSKANQDRARESNLKKNYGITLEDYNKMFEEQKGRCAICDTHQLDLVKKLAVDHCHTTGRVRKLLCHSCNVGVGHLRDDVDLLRKAIEYLIKN